MHNILLTAKIAVKFLKLTEMLNIALIARKNIKIIQKIGVYL